MKQHVQKMKDSIIMAILYHEVKLHDDTARHQFCPQGSDDEPSWCRFKREGEMEDKPHHLDPVFLDLLKPQFDRLSQPELSERCLAGYTQNQNKSFNNLVWIQCPPKKIKATRKGCQRSEASCNPCRAYKQNCNTRWCLDHNTNKICLCFFSLVFVLNYLFVQGVQHFQAFAFSCTSSILLCTYA